MFLKPFGCCCYPWLKPYAANKLSPKSSPCIFLGYYPHTKGYKCYDPSTTKVYISKHVKFVETEFPYPILAISSSISPTSFCVPLTSFEDLAITVPCFPLHPTTTSSRIESPSVSVPTSVPSPTSDLPSSSSVSHDSSPVSHMPPSFVTHHVSDSSQQIPLLHTSITQVPLSSASSDSYPSSFTFSIQPLPQNQHSMMTRSKHGIDKPKIVFGLNVVGPNMPLPDHEPVHFSEATGHA